MRSASVGVGIGADAVRAVELSGSDIVWAQELAVTEERPLPLALRELLATIPAGRWPRPSVAVVVGPTHAQLRRIRGLPEIRDRRVLASIVQQSVTRYFLQNGTPVLTTGPAVGGPGDPWAGAVEQSVVQAAAEACRAQGLRLLSVTPTAAVLAYAFGDGVVEWRDGDVRLLVTTDAAGLRECRRVPAGASGEERGMLTAAAPVSSLRALADGDAGARFADAYAAALDGGRGALALRPGRALSTAAPVPPARIAIAAVVCALSLLVAALAPGLSAARQERAARRALAALASRGREALAAERALADRTRLLAELAAFERSTSSPTLLLASLSEAIERPSMLAALHLDAAGGTLTALTPSAASLLAMLDGVPEISAPAIVGAVTPEAAPVPHLPPTGISPTAVPGAPPSPPGGARMERVTVRFRWRGAPSSATTTRGAGRP
jgi:hypothetical protein